MSEVTQADTAEVDFIFSKKLSASEKQAANAIKLYLNTAVNSGELMAFVRERNLENGGVKT